MIHSIRKVWDIVLTQIYRLSMLAWAGVLLMHVMQLNLTLNKWEKSIELLRILFHFIKLTISMRILINHMKSVLIIILVQASLLFIHLWKATVLLNINTLEALAKTILKIKLMILPLKSSEQRKWKEHWCWTTVSQMEPLGRHLN